MRYGVMSDTAMAVLDGREIYSFPLENPHIDTLCGYVTMAEMLGLDQLWIYPNSYASDRFEGMGEAFLSEALPSGYYYPYEDVQGSMTIKNNDGPVLQIVFPDYERLCKPLNSPQSPDGLLRYLSGLEEMLGIPFTKDLRTTGITLLEKSIPRDLLWNSTDFDIWYGNPPQDRYYYIPPTKGMIEEYPHVHFIDRNVAYFSACKNVLVGIEEAEYHAYPKFSRCEGLWNVDIVQDPFLPLGLPISIESGWQTTTSLSFLLDCGGSFRIREAYLFEESLPLLDTWYQKIERCLQEDSHGVYRDFIKGMANSAVGLMGHAPSEGEKRKWYGRPDIRASVMSSSVCTIRKVILYLLAGDYIPFYLNVDCIGFLSRGPFVVDKIPVPITKDIGNFKHVVSLPSKDIVGISSVREMNAIIKGKAHA